MPKDDMRTACACAMPARFARLMIAVGAYTAAAHSPQMADANSTVFTSVRCV
jgi:hypothetical protein